MNDKSYRKNVGLIVLNQKNQLLVCRRKDQQTWQFPQGGIDTGESPSLSTRFFNPRSSEVFMLN